MNYTAEQLLAIDCGRTDTAVVAGPGSGKTRVLVGRYLAIIEGQIGADLENTVAVTFTKKAASEMRERLRQQIDELAHSHPDAACRERWLDRKRRLDAALITTIHGLAARVLRDNPVAAGVDPHFATLDEFESAGLVDAAAEHAVARIAERATNAGVALMSAYSRRGLADHLVAVYRSLSGLGITVAGARQTTFDAIAARPRYGETWQQLDRCVAALAALAATKKEWAARVAGVVEAWSAVGRRLRSTPRISRTRQFAWATAQVRDALPRAAGGLKDAVLAVRALVGDDPGERGLAAAYHSATAADYAREIFTALDDLERTYTADKRARGALDYDDLQRLAHDLVARDEKVAAKVRRRVKFLLVDEFQDTNRLQHDLVRLIAPEGDGRLFVVGDPKQSIYGFRGAEVEVFDETAAAIAASGGVRVDLAANFRSDARLVDFQNALFSRLFADTGGVDYTVARAARPSAGTAPAVELLLSAGAAASDTYGERHRDSEARRVAARLRQIVDGGEVGVEEGAVTRTARYGDVGLLLRSTTDIKIYERALAHAGVPYHVVEGMGFYDRPEIVDILNLLAAVDNRAEELALAGALRSAIFGVSDEALLALRLARPDLSLPDALELCASGDLVPLAGSAALGRAGRLVGELRELGTRAPLSAVVAHALRATGFDVVAASCADGGERVANLAKLASLARAFERRRGPGLADFIAFVRDVRRLGTREAEAAERASADSVAVLTVHRAKGLEFPVVVMPDLHRQSRHEPAAFLADRQHGITFRVPDGSGRTAPTGVYALAAEARIEREAAESARVFYVGVTRARDFLLLSGVAAEGRGRNVASWLSAVTSVFDPAKAVGGTIVEGGAEVRIVLPGQEAADPAPAMDAGPEALDPDAVVASVRPMLGAVAAEGGIAARRASATMLAAYAECPRATLLGRLLAGSHDGTAARDSVHSPATLAPSVRGLIVHRFCETFRPGDDIAAHLHEAARYVAAVRPDECAGQPHTLADAVAAALLPSAEAFAQSAVISEIERHRNLPDHRVITEAPFLLRTRAGFVSGTIDTLLVTPLAGGRVRATVIDFKTGRIGRDGVEAAAFRYRLQMQTYALAARSLVDGCSNVDARLVFLADGAREYSFSAALLTEQATTRAVESAVAALLAEPTDPEAFPAVAGPKCRHCRFADICDTGMAHIARLAEAV